MASHSLLQVATLTVFALLVAAAPSPATSKACAAIKTELGAAKLLGPKDSGYKKENKDYWNFGLVALGPACIAMPKTAQDVSKIVNILNKSPSVEFAVKSGGHDPNVGHSSTKDGVLIAMRNVFGTEYDRARNVAYVKPGGHWSDVIVPLAKQGVTVVSGRLGMFIRIDM
jgi:FAD/FMN-containing dehydrogenase